MTYDQWKLSNPVDDGCGYDMVSSCCGTHYDEDKDNVIWCADCGDDCDIIEDYEYKAIRRENYLEMMEDEKRIFRK